MTAGSKPRLAVFDLDGTITRRDSYLQFLGAALGEWPARRLRLPLTLPSLLAYTVGARNRGDLKGELLRVLLGGLTREQLAPVVAAFVTRLVANGLHDEAPAAIAGHKAAGDTLVLMSASPDLYVPRVAVALGFDHCVCSAVRWKGERLDGRLAGANVRGEEKARQLALLRERFPEREAIGYGNAGSDLPHLFRCESAVYVNAPPGERQRLRKDGIRLVDWH